jgi:hypothetical protein
MDTLRRLAAYLVEHERVDGETFDELFDGRRPVPKADEEWRAATARPRAWGEVVDIAAARRLSAAMKPAMPSSAIASATVAAPIPAEVTPPAEMMEAAEAAVSSVATASVESIEAAEAPATFQAAATTIPAAEATARATIVRRRPKVGRRTARRARNVAADWLRRAERRLRSGELEADRL